MTPDHALRELTVTEEFFNRSTSALGEADSAFRPQPDMMTVAQQVAHVAATVEWFIDGAIDNHWDMDIEAGNARIAEYTSLASARAALAKAFDRARDAFGKLDAAALAAPYPPNPILQGPIYHAIEGIVDHTGHHRGVLSVYTRLLGRVPPMPYMG